MLLTSHKLLPKAGETQALTHLVTPLRTIFLS